MTDTTLKSEQCRAARALLNWSQSDFVKASGVSIATVKRLEAQAGAMAGNKPTIDALLSAFERAGIEFIGEGATSIGGGVGARLKAMGEHP